MQVENREIKLEVIALESQAFFNLVKLNCDLLVFFGGEGVNLM